MVYMAALLSAKDMADGRIAMAIITVIVIRIAAIIITTDAVLSSIPAILLQGTTGADEVRLMRVGATTATVHMIFIPIHFSLTKAGANGVDRLLADRI